MAESELRVGEGDQGHGQIVVCCLRRSRKWAGNELAAVGTALTGSHTMDRVVTIVNPRTQRGADLAFWLSRPMAERIAAVELLRRQVTDAADAGDAEPGLQRICRVAHKGVEYLVVGSYALAAHGHPRCSGDIDFWVDAAPDNLLRLLEALDDFEANKRASGRLKDLADLDSLDPQG